MRAKQSAYGANANSLRDGSPWSHRQREEDLICTQPGVGLSLSPHYTDKRFLRSQSVYCDPKWRARLPTLYRTGLPGLRYDYDDRLQEWDYGKFRAAVEVANDATPRHSARWLSALISHFRGRTCIVEHVVAGVNQWSGYPWWCAGWREEAAPRGAADEDGQ